MIMERLVLIDKIKFNIITLYDPLQKHERNGREYGCFPLVWKTKNSNERSTKFESLKQEQMHLEEENGKMIAL